MTDDPVTDGILSPFKEFSTKPALKCFVSHDYDDQDAVAALLRLLPARVEPIIFPPIPPSPSAAVTTALIKSISEADLLIYVKAGQSGTSHWVNFERRYALRRGIPTFAFESGRFERDTDKPSNIMIMPVIKYPPDDSSLVYSVVEWLEAQRNVRSVRIKLGSPGDQAFDRDAWTRQQDMMERAGQDFTFEAGRDVHVDTGMREFLHAIHWGAALVLFLSNAACERPWPSVDLYLRQYHRSARDGLNRPKFVWVEPPDARRIAAAFEAMGARPDNELFRGLVDESLYNLRYDGGTNHEQSTAADRRPLVVGDGREINWTMLDTLLIDLEAFALYRGTALFGSEFEHHRATLERQARREARRKMDQIMGRRTPPFDAEDF